MAFLIFLFSACRVFLYCLHAWFPLLQDATMYSDVRLQGPNFLCQWLQTSYLSCKHLWSVTVCSQFYVYLFQARHGGGPLESFSTLHVWPSHLRCLWLSRACMLEHLAFSSTANSSEATQMEWIQFCFLSSEGCPCFTSIKEYAGYICLIDFESGIHCQTDVLPNPFI